MKAHNPALCHAAARRAPKRHPQSAGSASASDSDNAFDELLLGLQDEFGHITLCVLFIILTQVSPLCKPLKSRYETCSSRWGLVQPRPQDYVHGVR